MIISYKTAFGTVVTEDISGYYSKYSRDEFIEAKQYPKGSPRRIVVAWQLIENNWVKFHDEL